MNRRYIRIVFLILVSILFCNSIWACSVCFSANEGNRETYYITTAFLTAMPLVFVGSFIYWYHKRLYLIVNNRN